MRLQFHHLLVSWAISCTCSIALAPPAYPMTLTDRHMAETRETPNSEPSSVDSSQTGVAGGKAASPDRPAPRPAEQRYPRKIKTKFAQAG